MINVSLGFIVIHPAGETAMAQGCAPKCRVEAGENALSLTPWPAPMQPGGGRQRFGHGSGEFRPDHAGFAEDFLCRKLRRKLCRRRRVFDKVFDKGAKP